MKDTTITAGLKLLLAKYNRLTDELGHHKELVPQLEAEEKALLHKADLKDKKQFEQISQIRLRRDIVPRKVEAFTQETECCLVELGQECYTVINALLEIVATKKGALVSELCETLEPFFKGRPAAAAAAATAMVYETNMGTLLFNPEERLKSNGLLQRPALFRAKELIEELAPVIESINIHSESTGKKIFLKTDDDLKRAELERLTDDPEEAILSKMSHGLSREAAVEAVKGRIKHLQDKFGKSAREREELQQLLADPAPFVRSKMDQGFDREDAEAMIERRKEQLQRKLTTAPPAPASEKT